MPYRSQIRRWRWHLDAEPSALWPLLGDTQRANEAAGLPKQTIREERQPDGRLAFFATAKKGPFALEWQEMPANWVSNAWFEHCRRFTKGPLKLLRTRLHLAPEGGGTVVSVKVEAQAADLWGVLILKGGFFKSTEEMYRDLSQDALHYLEGEAATPFTYEAPEPSDAAQRRSQRMIAAIEDSGHGHGLATRLVTLIFTNQEIDLMRLRPLALARQWQADPREVVELCLESVRSGLLEMRWDLLCPRCRVGKAPVLALDKLPKGAHCDVCDIAYDRDFSRNVELSFTPAPSVRAVSSGEYCLFGPMNTPHISLQITLAPDEVRCLDLALPAGAYRIRSLEPGPQCDLDFAGGGFPQVVLADDAVTTGDAEAPGRLRLENRTSQSLTAVVEERRWLRDALTADRATSLQTFRDLFSEQVLRPGDEVSVAGVALMFTDLKGSTDLFNRIGDAAAYHLVRAHFAFLTAIVRSHRGAVVKTIGDAIMASFSDPADALKAALAVQAKIASFNHEAGDAGLILKLGLHHGPSIMVNLNGRLDYFGATVNKAARLQNCSEGGDIVLSEEMAADPEVAALLAAHSARHETAVLKGFDAPIGLLRLTTVAES